MKIALMGTGSLGTIIGALLSKHGQDIVLIDAYEEHVKALNANGATVTGKMNLTVPVKAVTPDQMHGTYDIVFYLAKQTSNTTALKQLLPHLHENSVVCTLQNGLPEEQVSKIIGKDRVVGGVVGWGASFRGPGVSELTSDISSMRYEIGELNGEVTERIKTVAQLLNLAGECKVVTNLLGIRWAKVIQNATLSGMSAALGSNYGVILDHDKASVCAVEVGNEILKIVKTLDITLEDLVPGWSYYSLAYTDQDGLKKAMQWIRDYFEPHRLLEASMLQDMKKRVPSEIDYIVGICSDWGKKLNIPTPTCDTIIRIVKDYEAGNIPLPTMKNIDYFTLSFES